MDVKAFRKFFIVSLLALTVHLSCARILPDEESEESKTPFISERIEFPPTIEEAGETISDEEVEETVDTVINKLEVIEDEVDKVLDAVWAVEASQGYQKALSPRLEDVALEAEELQDNVDDVIDNIVDETGNITADVEDIEGEAVMLADDINALVGDVNSGIISTKRDINFEREMSSLKSEAVKVVRSVKDAQKKARRAERKRKRRNKKRRGKGKKRKNKKNRKMSDKAMYRNLNGTDVKSVSWLPQPISMFSDTVYPTNSNAGTKEGMQGDSPYYRRGYREQVEPDILIRSGGELGEPDTYFPEYRYSSSDAMQWKPRFLREYFANCDNCMERTDEYACPLNDEALEMKKWVGELQELISYGCQKPEICHEEGKCCLSGRPMFRELLVKVTDLVKDFRELIEKECSECSVDCGWSEWSTWSACDVTCGFGQRRRTRRKDNPPRKGGGRDCPGDTVQVEQCRNQECCVDGTWSSWEQWSPCPVTCGEGSIERRRVCMGRNYCGLQCPGPAVERDRCYSGQDCCVDGNWGSWGPWDRCSATCGRGMTSRQRSCNNPSANWCGEPCPGSGYETKECETQVCPTCQIEYGPWGPWSACTVSCGIGTVTRERPCLNLPGCPPCYETDRESKQMRCGPEESDAQWSSWERWTTCTATCGGGMQSRTRSCNPGPCQRECYGEAYESRMCGREECPRPCERSWSSWDSWSACGASCGFALRSRSRRCEIVRYGRDCDLVNCPGPSSEEEDCRLPDCCVDGNWGNWQPWSSCSATCGQGESSRRRFCDSPRPNFCGDTCPGRGYETRVCDGPSCTDCTERYTDWSPWTGCLGMCGMETVTRERRCYTDPLCEPCRRENEVERKRERCGPDRSDAQWSSWERWTSCTATCGGGMQSRTRSCNPGPCQRNCFGDEYESRVCGRDECPRACERSWTTWDSWSSCSASCGYAVRSRSRRCEIARFGRDCDLVSCPGPANQEEDCNLPDCCTWGPWSECSATCRGAGVRERQQICYNERNQPSTRNVEKETCFVDGPECPGRYRWAMWENWCDCDCRLGVNTRVRKCISTSNGEAVDFNHCPGEAREDKTCDVRDIRNCPQCIMSCEGRADGKHPSCTGCGEYVDCQNGVAKFYKCSEGFQWDGFMKKCARGLSKSCMLKESITSCAGLSDGKYHSVRGCGYFVVCDNGALLEDSCVEDFEFNYYAQRCERRRSPSCIRFSDVEVNTAIIGGEFVPVNDAPSADYFNETLDLSEELAKKKYTEEIEKAEIEGLLEVDIEESVQEETDKPEELEVTGLANPDCITDCSGVSRGKYPSCKGCEYYAICTVHGRFRETRCRDGHQYDAIEKSCVSTSSTCKKVGA